MIKTAIKQPVLVNLLFILVMIAGVIYASASTKELYPDVTIPGVFCRTIYPGISAREMEKLVSRPIEDAVADVDHVDHIFSTSYEGMSFIWIEMNPDADIDKAVLDIQNKVNEIQKDLPPDAQTPYVAAGRMQIPVIQVAVTGPRGGNPHLLRTTAKTLKERLESLSGVDEVMEAGIHERQIRVVALPRKLQAYNVSATQLFTTLQARNRNLPGGTIQSGGREYVVRPISEYGSLDDIRNAIVVKRPDGQHVRVRHLAKVIDGFADRQSGAWVDGRPGVVLSVIKRKGVDGHKVVARTRDAVKKYQKALPRGFATKLMGDTTKEVDRGMSILYRNGGIGIALVLVLLWVFLGLRNALLTALGIPFALAGGIVFMHLMGVTINSLSLFALIICIGIIVDDAIVVVENTVRYIEAGHKPAVAALLGTREVMWPVISTVLTTIAAFLPLLLMTGVMGKFMAVIPKVVTAALLASLIEALIILPSHVADFAKVRKRRGRQGPAGDGRVLALGKRFYGATFKWVLKLRYVAVPLTIVTAIAITSLAFMYKEVVLFGEEDSDMVDVRVEMPQGSSLAATEKVLKEIEQIARKLPGDEVVAVVTQSGWSRTHLWPKVGKHRGMVTLMLKNKTARKRTADEIMAQLRPQLAHIPGPVKPLEVLKLQFGPPKGKPVAIRLSGDNLDRLLSLAEKVESELAKIRGVKDIGRDYHLGSPEFRVRVDEARAALHGLGTADVGRMIALAYLGIEATKFRQGDEEMKVVLRYPESFRRDARELLRMPLILPSVGAGGASGAAALSLGVGVGSGQVAGVRTGTLTLRDVATLERGKGPATIMRRDRRRTITVTANLDTTTKVTSQGVNREAKDRLAGLMAANPDVIFQFGGEWEKTDESLQSLFRAFIVALLCIYLILGALFRSFLQPLVVILAVPLSIIGVVVGFFVSGNPIDMIALMGVVGLAGIVVNDSLILVDFINQRRRQGVARNDAIMQAGQLRLRPVLLTSVTTIFGLMPMSMGWGGDSGNLAPMATAIAWGLTFATVLTLYIVPSTYAIMDDLVNGVYRIFGKRKDWRREDLDALDELSRLPLKEAVAKAETQVGPSEPG